MKKVLFLLMLIAFQFSISQSVKVVATKTDQMIFEADDFIGFDGFGSCFYSKNNTVFKKVAPPPGQVPENPEHTG